MTHLQSPPTVAICIQKGGVGKTATSINLAAALAERGVKVLLLDLDPQAQASDHLALRDEGPLAPMLQVLQGAMTVMDAAVKTPFGFSLVPGGQSLAAAEPMLQAEAGGEQILRERLQEVPAGLWDLVLLDCPPSLGTLNLSALTAAHAVLVPLPPAAADLDGLGLLSRTMERVKRRTNPGLSMLGILPNKANGRTKLGRDVLTEVENFFPGALFKEQIRQDTRIAEAYSARQPVIRFAPKSNGAADFRALAKAVMGRSAALGRAAAIGGAA